jgi:hypothetical protein
MKKISLIAATLVGAAVLCAAPISLHQAQDKGLSLSVDKAQAYYGHYRRVNRRVHRRDIITTATITIIGATIITITAIGKTYRVVAVPQG